jgi:integrase
VSAPPTRRTDQRFLTIEQSRTLLHATNQRDYIILRIFVGCGLRPSELFALRVDDTLTGELRIDETVIGYSVTDQTKTEGSRATVTLAAGLERELRDYIRVFKIRDYLFPSETGRTPIMPDNYLDRRLKKLGVLAHLFLETRICKNGKKIVVSGLNHQIIASNDSDAGTEIGQYKGSSKFASAHEPKYNFDALHQDVGARSHRTS